MPTFFKPIPLYCHDFPPFPLSETVEEPSFRRLMQKAQVFSLENDSTIRNRLTHSLEVADVGKSLAHEVGKRLCSLELADSEDADCLVAIVENACLVHDIGNPPFGHFGEKAIQKWFAKNKKSILHVDGEINISVDQESYNDLMLFDGNSQGFRILTKLHAVPDDYNLNLSYSTLLTMLKYPCCNNAEKKEYGLKKIGMFSGEKNTYNKICEKTGHIIGTRYFLVYLMELADDICYCLSDIADGFEKKIVDSRFFKEELRKIIDNLSSNKEEAEEIIEKFIPSGTIKNFSQEFRIPLCESCIQSASKYFADNIQHYLTGKGCDELSAVIKEGLVLKGIKDFARKYIYTNSEVQRIEIAGDYIVKSLLDHYGLLLEMETDDFRYFCNNHTNLPDSNYDYEWRVFNQLSKRMIKAYDFAYKNNTKKKDRYLLEKILRSKLIVDYISGMTDQTALSQYQNFRGIKL